jgi:hypothetical protein
MQQFHQFNYIKKTDKDISMKFYQTIPWLAPFYWLIWTFVAIINVIVYILLTLFSQTTGPMYTKLGKFLYTCISTFLAGGFKYP